MSGYGEAEVLEVCVPVATMWTSPDAPREVDQPAVLDRPDVAGWTAAMDATVRKGLTGRTLTQLLLGEPVHVLERTGEWIRVAALWQPSSQHPSGYPGWVRRSHLAAPVPASEFARRAVVTAPATPLTLLHGEADQVSFGTSLVVGEEAGGASDSLSVLVPSAEGPVEGRLARSDVRLTAPTDHAAYTPEDSLAAAGGFLGLRYLWGGTAAWGLDCSGLVHLVLRSLGIEVPRDAFDQAARLTPVPLDDVQRGDLYFFARPGERVYHVGFVSAPVAADGTRTMLHAPEGGELIEDAPLAPHRVETLVSAGRVQGRVSAV